MPTVDPEFKKMIPPISDAEFELLRESLKDEGCRDALVLWDDIILDGHNRHTLCTELGIAYRTTSIELADRENAKFWIFRNQLARRNLSFIAAAYMRGKLYLMLKGRQGRRKQGVAPSGVQVKQQLAEQIGCAMNTIGRNAALAESVDSMCDDARDMVLAPGFIARTSQVIDLAALSHDNQQFIVSAIEAGKFANLQVAIMKLRGPRQRHESIKRCPTCGGKIVGEQCLKCSLSDAEVFQKLAAEEEREEELKKKYTRTQEDTSDGWQERAAKLRKFKQAGDDIGFHIESLSAWVSGHPRNQNVKAYRKLDALSQEIIKAK